MATGIFRLLLPAPRAAPSLARPLLPHTRHSSRSPSFSLHSVNRVRHQEGTNNMEMRLNFPPFRFLLVCVGSLCACHLAAISVRRVTINAWAFRDRNVAPFSKGIPRLMADAFSCHFHIILPCLFVCQSRIVLLFIYCFHVVTFLYPTSLLSSP